MVAKDFSIPISQKKNNSIMTKNSQNKLTVKGLNNPVYVFQHAIACSYNLSTYEDGSCPGVHSKVRSCWRTLLTACAECTSVSGLLVFDKGKTKGVACYLPITLHTVASPRAGEHMHLCVRVLQSVLVQETGPLGLRDQPGLRLYL